MNRFSMSRFNLAAAIVSLIALLFIGLATSQCDRNSYSKKLIVTTETIKPTEPTDKFKKSESKTKSKKKTKTDTVPHSIRRQPSSRQYLDEQL